VDHCPRPTRTPRRRASDAVPDRAHSALPAPAHNVTRPQRPRGGSRREARRSRRPGLTPAEVVASLRLAPHPEGGFFRETYRSSASTAILYLLAEGEKSNFHRMRATSCGTAPRRDPRADANLPGWEARPRSRSERRTRSTLCPRAGGSEHGPRMARVMSCAAHGRAAVRVQGLRAREEEGTRRAVSAASRDHRRAHARIRLLLTLGERWDVPPRERLSVEHYVLKGRDSNKLSVFRSFFRVGTYLLRSRCSFMSVSTSADVLCGQRRLSVPSIDQRASRRGCRPLCR